MNLKDLLYSFQIDELFQLVEKNDGPIDDIQSILDRDFTQSQQKEAKECIERVLVNTVKLYKDLLLKDNGGVSLEMPYYKLIRETVNYYHQRFYNVCKNALTFGIVIPNLEPDAIHNNLEERLEAYFNEILMTDHTVLNKVFKVVIVRHDKLSGQYDIHFVHKNNPEQDHIFKIMEESFDASIIGENQMGVLYLYISLLQNDRDKKLIKVVKHDDINPSEFMDPEKELEFLNSLFADNFKKITRINIDEDANKWIKDKDTNGLTDVMILHNI